MALFKSIEKSLNEINCLSENVKILARLEDISLRLKKINLRSFLEEEITRFNHFDCVRFFIGIDGDFLSKEKVSIHTDPELLSMFIRNFINNSINHGKDETGEKMIVLFNISEEENSIIVDLVNNGKPFHEGFNFPDFIQLGKRSGSTKGSGLGGFIMWRITKLLKMSFNMSLVPMVFEINKEDDEVMNIIGNVHFQLRITQNDK